MAHLQQKRPSISNWFSSLRRQPKGKKSALATPLYGPGVGSPLGGGGGGGHGGKQFQRSCIDLSSNSTFYLSPDVAAVAADKKFPSILATLPRRGKGKRNGTPATGVPPPPDDDLPDNGCVETEEEEDDRRGLVTGKRVSQLCSRCCCSLRTPSSLRAHQKSRTPGTAPQESVANCALPSQHPFTSTAAYNIPASPPATSTAVSTLSSRLVVETEMRRGTEITQLPSDEPHTLLYNKRSEFRRTTTTTTTRTLVVSRPVELVLNERGEVVARRPFAEQKKRSNSFDCVLDRHEDDERLEGDGDMYAADADGDGDDDAGKGYPNPDFEDSDSGVCVSPRPIGPDALSLSAAAGEDNTEFRFIDDSSASQSETERNSLKAAAEEHAAQHHNNNNEQLCNVCRGVVERNRNNTARSPVIMRRQQIKDELCEVISEMEALDVPEDSKHSNKDKQMSIGRKKFNMDPKKGIEYLVENRLLRHDPQDVAHFLYKGEGLNKTAIGDYLGEKNDFNEDVLKAFVALHDFTNLILVQALRQFLWSFRLPGEAQKIDRMMECFAQRYCQLNPDIFTNTDTCYVLSFAIIMLNTSLHNPSVKDKPTVEQFISMNRGINNGGDLPRGLLESLYESIRTEPFKIPQDDGNDLMHTFFNPDKEGWLWKQGGRYKSWKRRWFILNDNCLYYFEYTTDKEPRGIIPLENISVREIHDRSKPHCFELFATGGADIIKACKTDSEGKVVEGKHTVYRMSAATEEDQQEWIKRLTQSISHNPFYDILVQRKKKALSKS